MRYLVFVLLCCSLLVACEGILYNSPKEEQRLYCGTKDQGYPMPENKALFSTNCAACHHPVKNLTGPALFDALQYRDMEWLYRFLTDEHFKPIDKRSKELRKQFGISCMKFPQLTREEVGSLFSYR